MTSTGQVFAWGRARDGQLGDGSTHYSDLPVKVQLPDTDTWSPMSWVPPNARGFQPHSTYLIDDGDGPPVIVDPGLSYLERPVVSSLQRLLADDAKPVVFLTRAQLDSIGNLGALAETFPIEDVFTGGNHNPFDSFDAVNV